MNIRISVSRFDPDTDSRPKWVDYEVPTVERMTVLQALMHVYENLDPTLAFRFGCRFGKCGLCAVEVNGRPRMGCSTQVRDGMKIGPLSRLPVLRDLAVDRALFFEGLRKLELFVPEPEERSAPAKVREPESRAKLLLCVECLGCQATCPASDGSGPASPFAGPYAFVKLAQLHLDPRNRIDRRRQAQDLGIAECLKCRKCRCINGIDIQGLALAMLAGE
ncbi:MAG: 2Fe-2S iron-sulfur cluster-binding protein [bacterium]